MRKLVLIRPSSNNPSWKNSDRFCYPIGLASLATYVRHNVKDTSIKVLDSETDSVNLREALRGTNYIGTTSSYGSHKNALDILKRAKSLYPKVKTLLGGPHTRALGKQILSNNSYVDYITDAVCAEETLAQLLKGKKPDDIPAFYYRQKGEVMHSEEPGRLNLDDYVYDLENLEVNESRLSHYWFPVRSVVGCIKNVSCKERCLFCSIGNQGLHLRSPRVFWEQLDLLYSKYGINKFFEVGDSILLGNYLRNILKTKPKTLRNVQIHANAEPIIDDKTATILKKLGILFLFLGIESGSDQMLEAMGKRHRCKDMFATLECCQKHQIAVSIPLVLGCPGESEKTLRETERFVDLVFEKYKEIIRLYVPSIAIPIPGSRLFAMCQTNKKITRQYSKLTGQDILQTDTFDFKLLQRLMVDEFCEVSYQRLAEFRDELSSRHKIKEMFSWLASFS